MVSSTLCKDQALSPSEAEEWMEEAAEHLEQQCKVSSLLDFSASPVSFPLEAVTEPHQRKGKLPSSRLS